MLHGLYIVNTKYSHTHRMLMHTHVVVMRMGMTTEQS